MSGSESIICAIYARVSDESQAKGDSIDHQVSFCKAYARRRSSEEARIWATPDEWVYVDAGISGTSLLGREAVQQLIADAKQHAFSVVLFKGISRFARDTVDALILLRILAACNVRILSMEENFDSQHHGAEFLFTIHSALAQAESEKTAIRVRMGAAEKAKQGKWNGQPPMGYRLDADSQKLTVNPTDAALIRQIFDWYQNGLGCRRIADMLNRGGHCTKAARLWSARQVARVLQNPAYVGDVVYGRTEQKPVIPEGNDVFLHKRRTVPTTRADELVIVHDAHPGLVNRQTFSATQQLLAAHSQSAGRTGHDHLLTKGLLKCRCDSSMTIKHNGHGVAYYRCIRQMDKGRTVCDAPYLRADDVERAVLLQIRGVVAQLMRDYRGDPLVSQAPQASQAPPWPQLTAHSIEQQRNSALEKSRLLFARYADGVISEAQFRRINQDIRQTLQGLERAQSDIEARQANKGVVHHVASAASGRQAFGDTPPHVPVAEQLQRHLTFPVQDAQLTKWIVSRVMQQVCMIGHSDSEIQLCIQYRLSR